MNLWLVTLTQVGASDYLCLTLKMIITAVLIQVITFEYKKGIHMKLHHATILEW